MALSTSVMSSPSTHVFYLLYFCFYTCMPLRTPVAQASVYICPYALRQTPHGHMCIGVLGSGCVDMYSVRVLRLRNTSPVSSIPCSGVYRRLYMYLCTTPYTTWAHVYRCVGLCVRVHVLCTFTSSQEHLSCIVYFVFRRPLPCNPSTAHMCISHRSEQPCPVTHH